MESVVEGDAVCHVFLGTHDDVDVAVCVGARRAAVAVCESLRGEGLVVVYDVAHLFYVESASRQVGGHEHGCGAVVEHFDGLFAVALLHSAVVTGTVHAVLAQPVVDAVGALAVVDEDDGAFRPPVLLGEGGEEAEKRFQLVVGVGVHAVHAQARTLLPAFAEVEAQRGGERQEIGESVEVGGRCQDGVAHVLQALHYASHFVLEAKLKALVELVEHEDTHRSEVDVAAHGMVEQTARRGHHDVGDNREGVLLILGLVASVEFRNLEAFCHCAEHGSYLEHEFASGSDDDTLHASCRGTHEFEHGEHESQRLSGAGGG